MWLSKIYHTLHDITYSSDVMTQIPPCIIQSIINAPFCNLNVHTCTHFGHKMLHDMIWDQCIVGFVQQVYCCAVTASGHTRWQNCGLYMHRECQERLSHHRHQRKPLFSDPSMHHDVMHVRIANPRGWEKHSLLSRCIRKPHFTYLVRGPCTRA